MKVLPLAWAWGASFMGEEPLAPPCMNMDLTVMRLKEKAPSPTENYFLSTVICPEEKLVDCKDDLEKCIANELRKENSEAKDNYFVGAAVCLEESIENCADILKNDIESEIDTQGAPFSDKDKKGVEEVVELGIKYCLDRNNTKNFTENRIHFFYNPASDYGSKRVLWKVLLNGPDRNYPEIKVEVTCYCRKDSPNEQQESM
jgi:hypothetical protein